MLTPVRFCGWMALAAGWLVAGPTYLCLAALAVQAGTYSAGRSTYVHALVALILPWIAAALAAVPAVIILRRRPRAWGWALTASGLSLAVLAPPVLYGLIVVTGAPS